MTSRSTAMRAARAMAKRPAAVAAVALFATLSVACSDDGSGSSPDGGEAVPLASTAVAVPDTGDEASDQALPGETDSSESAAQGGGADDAGDGFVPYEERRTPLDGFLANLTTEAFPDHDYPDPDAAVEDMIFDCMASEGFRYARVDHDAWDAGFDQSLVSVFGRDYAAAHGYGITRRLGHETLGSSYVDPNLAIRDGLSESQLTAWDQRFYECQQPAWEKVLFPPQEAEQALLRVFEDELDALQARIETDPRIAAATAEWSACMAAEGYRYSDQREVIGYLRGLGAPLEARIESQGGLEQIDASLRADLDSLLAQEIEIALTDYRCSRPLEKVRYEVAVEHQERFLEDNQDRLALLGDELG